MEAVGQEFRTDALENLWLLPRWRKPTGSLGISARYGGLLCFCIRRPTIAYWAKATAPSLQAKAGYLHYEGAGGPVWLCIEACLLTFHPACATEKLCFDDCYFLVFNFLTNLSKFCFAGLEFWPTRR